jgi:hypothetical protein
MNGAFHDLPNRIPYRVSTELSRLADGSSCRVADLYGS